MNEKSEKAKKAKVILVKFEHIKNCKNNKPTIQGEEKIERRDLKKTQTLNAWKLRNR